MIAAAARRALEARLGRSVDFDVPLSRHTSLGVGGPADALATPVSQAELAACSALAAELGLPLLVLGGGFNTLVLDGGVEGLVLRTQRLRGLSLEPSDPEGQTPGALPDGRTLVAEAGVSPSQVMRFTVAEGLTGLEIGAGIPGSVGGWVAMNAGVPGREVGDVVVDVEVVAAGGAPRRLTRDEMGFVYRGARGLEPSAVVAGARFALAPAEPAAVRTEIERHLAHRRATQPIDQPSFGSVWKNPPGERAGRLIELAGLKGAREGGAQISSVHANFIVNRGGATAADVLALMRRAAEAVQERTGIVLEPEVRIAGREAR